MTDRTCKRCNHGYHRGQCPEILSKTREIHCACMEFRGIEEGAMTSVTGRLDGADRPAHPTTLLTETDRARY